MPTGIIKKINVEQGWQVLWHIKKITKKNITHSEYILMENDKTIYKCSGVVK
jgi:hypothetical protein